MKQVFSTLAVAALTLSLSSASFAGNDHKYYAITNDDNPNSNTATIFRLLPNKTIVQAGAPLVTGGSGLGGGYFANHSNAIESNASCLFVSDAGSQDIATFIRLPGGFRFAKVGNYPSGENVSNDGIGLVVSPDGKTLFASLDEAFEIATFSVNSDCSLTAGPTQTVNDLVGPMAITNDGKALIVPEVDYGIVDAFSVNGTTLTPLGTPVDLGLSTTCSSDVCSPTGTDISDVDSNGNALVVLGDATTTAPSYFTIPLNETVGLSSSGAAFNTISGITISNIETPWFSHAGVQGNGYIYFGASGFGAGNPAGVSVNSFAAGAINPVAIGSLRNFAAFYAGNVSSAIYQGTVQKSDYLWQVGTTSGRVSTVYVYKVDEMGTSVTQVAKRPDAQAHSTAYVVSITAFPKR